MSKKNSKKRWKNQHEEALRLERLDAEKKAARAAKRAEKLREASGEMMTDDGGSDAGRRGAGGKKKGAAKALGGGALAVQATLRTTPSTKNSRKIVKGVRVGLIQKKLKLRKGATIRGIKIVDADSKQRVLDELKAEAAFKMAVD